MAVTERPLFGPRTPLLLAAAGIAAFIGWMVLTAFGGTLREGHDEGAHALAVNGTGYAGLVTLVRAAVPGSYAGRSRLDVANAGLAVLTPVLGATDAGELGAVVQARGARPTLIVLPKWLTIADPLRSTWVRRVGTVPLKAVQPWLNAVAPGHAPLLFEAATKRDALLTVVADRAPLPQPSPVRSLIGRGLVPVIVDAGGRVVLGRIGRGVYVLADPDLVANHGLRQPANARAAVALVTSLAPPGGSIVFDVTLAGFGREQHSLAELVLRPPFLGLTLCIGAAALLAGFAAVPRFGTPPVPPRALAFGKRALIDNAAALIRIARREPAAAVRYVDTVVDRAAAKLRLGSVRDRAELIRQIEAHRSAGSPLGDLAAAARAARTPAAALAAAAALHQWQKDVTREFG